MLSLNCRPVYRLKIVHVCWTNDMLTHIKVFHVESVLNTLSVSISNETWGHDKICILISRVGPLRNPETGTTSTSHLWFSRPYLDATLTLHYNMYDFEIQMISTSKSINLSQILLVWSDRQPWKKASLKVFAANVVEDNIRL